MLEAQSRVSLRWLFVLTAWASISFALLRLGFHGRSIPHYVLFVVGGMILGPCLGCVLGLIVRYDQFKTTLFAFLLTMVGTAVTVIYLVNYVAIR